MITAGSRLGSYEVLSALGAGGMGEVYRATDTRVGREVALKLLPEMFAADPERLARFEREARLLASLNHPTIAHLYGFETATATDGSTVHLIAMELVEGEDLAERLKRGPIPVDESIAIAQQIAEALEEAHEKGVIHRDLKPANVKLTPDGKVKVLDFGLAKAYAGDVSSGSSPDVSQSPTLAHTGTQAGLILGTAAYMSPEQARGKQVDKRADIWAFGVVLYEMLAGKRLFAGETVSDILAAVLRQEIEWTALPAAAPVGLRALLRDCLARDPRQRLRDIGDARRMLERSSSGDDDDVAANVAAPVGTPRWRRALPWIIAALAVATLVASALLDGHRGTVPDRAMKLAVLPPAGMVSAGVIDVSADGLQIAFTAAGDDGRTRLYVRSLDALEARALPGTEGADAPFFSPDGRSLGFFAEKKLKRVDLAGGPPRELAEAPEHRGGSWGTQNVIVFAPEGGGTIFRVASAGGDVAPVTRLDPTAQENSHRWPRFLPDGTHFLFMSRKLKPPGRLAVEVGSIDGRERKRLTDSSTGGAFARGRLYFTREATVLAQAFDSRTLAVSGEAVPVAEDVWRSSNVDGLTAFSVAEDGALVYRRGGLVKGQLTWLDRQGQPLGTLGAPALLGDTALSPDGRHALADVTDPIRGTSGIFSLDVASGMTTRLTFGAGNQSTCRYTPDGRFVVFGWDQAGALDLYRQEIGASADPTPLLVSPAWKFPESFSPDARFLTYSLIEPGKSRDIWVLPMTGGGKPFPFTQTPADEWGSVFSPDGRFIAYVSDEAGRSEVFVRTFPASSAKWQVSSGGGISPAWRRDGKEFFYLAPDRSLVAVPIGLATGAFVAGPSRPLFRNAALQRPLIAGGANPYVVTADGQRFLANVVIGQAESSPIVLQTGGRR